MRFGVLGPLAVWTSEGRLVRVPEVKVRALLAGLLINSGRVVPADRLIDDLWGESLPANPAGALQTRVSQLRRALEDAEPGGRELVVSRPPGYLLQVAPDAVDVGRFQALIVRARATGDAQTRAALLTDALALWRGAALLDFADEEFARAESTRLEEQRLTALEEQAEARLEIGEHDLLADELGDLVARHGLRERLRAAHLRALYRAGRQSEALDSYRDLRERLAEDLGLDPSPALAALYQAILEQDPALGGPAAAPRSNLPAALSDLIGRSDALAQVRALLDAGRLVTLTGPGGVGKTRLALEVASQVVGAYPDGVWLVELAGTRRPAAVAEVVAAALGIRDEAATPERLVDRLADALRAKVMLLVLDNCEHLVEEVAELSSALLKGAPRLRVLATSQVLLGVASERVWPVRPLEESSAVRMFVSRAVASAPGFALDATNAEAVAAICRRLDGIPLALELAATRVRTLGVHELARRLDDRFRVLAAGYSDAPTRQRTLRAMVDWSWELLSEAERTVLRRLAVHADGCTLSAAEAVCAEPGLDVVDLLARLVDRSLVAVHGEEPRYRLLESVAAYGHDRLCEAGESGVIRERHRRYYTDLAKQAEPQLRGPAQREWLRRLDAEAANLRSAVEQGDALALVNALAWYWVLRGRLGEGHRALTTALTGSGSSAARHTAAIWLAAFKVRLGEAPEPVAAASRPQDLDDLAAMARAEWFLGFAMIGVGDLSAGEELISETLAVFRAIGDQWGTAAALSTRARQALVRSDLPTVKGYGEQGMARFAELGDRWGQLHASFPLAVHAEIVGDYELAARLHRDGLRMAEDLGLATDISDKLSMLGRIALLNGDLLRADELHERAASVAAEQGYLVGEEFAGIGLALSARRQGRLDVAETHLRKWLEWDLQIGSDTAVALLLAELGFVAEQRGSAETARSLHLEGMAAARETGDPRAVALALEGLAGAEAVAGRPDRAALLLGTAAAARQSVGAPLPAGEHGDVDRITALARAAGSFDTQFERGHAMTAEEVLKEI